MLLLIFGLRARSANRPICQPGIVTKRKQKTEQNKNKYEKRQKYEIK